MLAIDFGTSRVKVAYLQNGEAKLAPLGQGNLPFIPALFYIPKEGDIIVGDEAKDMLNYDSKGVLDTLKRKLREPRIRKNRRNTTPKELLELLFKQIRERCSELPHVFSEPPLEVVLTYPARYTEVEKKIIRSAASEVGFTEIEMVSEPEAAALAWQNKVGSSLSSDVVVILDCGGGTADWACLKQREGKLRLFSEIPPGGDESLGGHDVDDQLLKLMKERLEDEEDDDALSFLQAQKQEVLFQLKTIKEKYSNKKGSLPVFLRTVRLGTKKVEFTEEDLQNIFEARIIANLVTNFSEYLRKVQLHTGTGDPVVLLVGGTGQLKGLKEGIQERCGVKVVWWMESEFATVQGALYSGNAAAKEEERKKEEALRLEEERLQEARRVAEEEARRRESERIEREYRERQEAERLDEERRQEARRVAEEEARRRESERLERERAEAKRLKEEAERAATFATADEFTRSVWLYWKSGMADVVPGMNTQGYAMKVGEVDFRKEIKETAYQFLRDHNLTPLKGEVWVAGGPWEKSMRHAFFLSNYRLVFTEPVFRCIPLYCIRTYDRRKSSTFLFLTLAWEIWIEAVHEDIFKPITISNSDMGTGLFPVNEAIHAVLNRREFDKSPDAAQNSIPIITG